MLTLGPAVDAPTESQALRVLAAYVPLMFVASIVWNILIAGRRERILVALSVGLVTMNVVLNLALIPRFGFQGAAYAAVTSEALGLLVGGIVIWRLQGIVPRLRHLRALLPSLGVMTIVILLVPGPWLVVAATAVTIYAAIILSAPGAIQKARSECYDDVGQLLLSTSLVRGTRLTRLCVK